MLAKSLRLTKEELFWGFLFLVGLWLLGGWAVALVVLVAMPHVGIWLLIAYAATILALVIWYES